jgi:small subunit ribosomal protein S5
MVAVGNNDGKVGIGIGRDEEVPDSIEKGRTDAEKNLESIPRAGSTIPHQIESDHDSAQVLLKPAAPGTGVIAGGAVRAVIELAGIEDILTKSLGSDNPLNIARATLQGLLNLKDPHSVAQARGVSVEKILAEHPYAGPDDVEDFDGVDEEEESESDESGIEEEVRQHMENVEPRRKEEFEATKDRSDEDEEQAEEETETEVEEETTEGESSSAEDQESREDAKEQDVEEATEA